MYTRIVLGSLRAGCWDEYQSYYIEQVVPSTKGTKGLCRRLLLRSTENPDEGVSLSVWESTEDLRIYELSQTRKQMMEAVESLYQPWAYAKGDYHVKHFEVVSTDHFSDVAVETRSGVLP